MKRICESLTFVWRRQWHPTSVLLPGKSHGWRSLVGCSPWGREELDMSDFTLTFHFHALEKEMTTHFSVLACRIPGTAEPGGLPYAGSHRVRHTWSNLAVAAAAATVYIVYKNYTFSWDFLGERRGKEGETEKGKRETEGRRRKKKEMKGSRCFAFLQ